MAVNCHLQESGCSASPRFPAPGVAGSAKWHTMPAVEIVTFFLQTGWVAKVVLVTLIIFSLASWSVILGKWRELSAAKGASERFLKVFREAARFRTIANSIFCCGRRPI